ncbi:hypothetical protein [Planctomycetes bacterium Poly30]|uniref:hypothetical protein n=1 Tax=Saltatorellus ferox TaxID=2528018 RepID=UPI0011A6F415
MRTSVRSPWIDYPSYVVIDGDATAVGGTSNTTAGAISICERDAFGDWHETTLLIPPARFDWSVEALVLNGTRLAALRSRDVGPEREYVLHTYQRYGRGDWRIDGRRSIPTPAGSPSVTTSSIQPPWTLLFDGNDLVVSSVDDATFYSAAPGAPITSQRRVTGLGLVLELDGGTAIGVERSLARVVDLRTQPGDIEVARLIGQVTCPPTGTAILYLHRRADGVSFAFRRVVARIEDAPPGATALLFRSSALASAPAASSGLCLDRQSLIRVGVPTSIGPAGRATFTLTYTGPASGTGIENAENVQAVLLGGAQAGAFSLTNGMAWIE